jgi:hypothetical protein
LRPGNAAVYSKNLRLEEVKDETTGALKGYKLSETKD